MPQQVYPTWDRKLDTDCDHNCWIGYSGNRPRCGLHTNRNPSLVVRSDTCLHRQIIRLYRCRMDCNCHTIFQQNTSSCSTGQTFYRPYIHTSTANLIRALSINGVLRKYIIIGLCQHTIPHKLDSIFRHDYRLSSISISPYGFNLIRLR